MELEAEYRPACLAPRGVSPDKDSDFHQGGRLLKTQGQEHERAFLLWLCAIILVGGVEAEDALRIRAWRTFRQWQELWKNERGTADQPKVLGLPDGEDVSL